MLYKFTFLHGEWLVAKTMYYTCVIGYIFHDVVACGGGLRLYGQDMALRPSWRLKSVYPVKEDSDYESQYMSL